MTDLLIEEYSVSVPSEALGLLSQYVLGRYPSVLCSIVLSVLQHFSESEQVVYYKLQLLHSD